MAVTGDMTWEEVEAMDVEWAHAAAPGANIVLVEANDNTIGNIMTAVNTARNMSGVSVVVVACTFNEGAVGASLEQTYDSIFTTPSGHTPVTFVAGTGNLYPQTVTYPAVSPNVISVGGTAFEFDSSGDFLGEVPWADDQEFTVQDTYTLVGGDGGTSTVENRPAYQNSVQATGGKDAPDVSFLADPDYVDNYDSPVGGVCVCDSYDNNGSAAEGYGPWEVDGGTNLGAACWAGLIADVDAERVTEGLPALDGPTQALPDLYAIHNYGQTVSSGSPFFDVFNVIATTSTGYDTETGLGTPGLNLIPALAGAPGVTVAAAAAGDTATTALLSVQGEDLDFGSQNLAYTWVCTSKPSTAATPTFSVNDSIAAEETVATFYEAGTYTFTVAMTDAEGMSAYSSTTAVISQVATEVTVSPSPATIVSGHTQQFAVTGIDQFGNSMTPTVTWGTTGGVGTISSSGLLTASYAAETGTVTATATSAFGNAFGSANVTVTNTPPVINWVTGSPSPVTGTQAVLSCVANRRRRPGQPELHLAGHHGARRRRHPRLQRQQQQRRQHHHGHVPQGGQLHLPDHRSRHGRVIGRQHRQRDGGPDAEFGRGEPVAGWSCTSTRCSNSPPRWTTSSAFPCRRNHRRSPGARRSAASAPPPASSRPPAPMPSGR